MLELLKALTLTFHDRHYLPILLKKHLIGIHFDNLPELSKEDLKERLKLIEEVSTLFRNKRFALNEMFQRSASKFAIFYV